MGKIDDMQRQREQQYADRQSRRTKAPSIIVEPATPPKRDPAVARAALAPKVASPDDEKGTCSVCGKTKALANGMLVQHQKGFGSACAGSRKPPA